MGNGKGDDLRNYKGRFALPHAAASPGAPAAGCCGEDWYWFDQGAVRFIIYPEPYAKETWPDWARKAEPLFAAAAGRPGAALHRDGGPPARVQLGTHDGKAQLRAILDGFGRALRQVRPQPERRTATTTSGRSRKRTSSTSPRESAAARSRPPPTACKWADCKPPAWVAFRAIHHGFVKLTVRADGIALEAICAGASPAEDSVRCADGESLDQALIAAGQLTRGAAPPDAPQRPPGCEGRAIADSDARRRARSESTTQRSREHASSGASATCGANREACKIATRRRDLPGGSSRSLITRLRGHRRDRHRATEASCAPKTTTTIDQDQHQLAEAHPEHARLWPVQR